MGERSDINQETFQTVVSALSEFDTDRSNEEWLTDVTEKWCRDRAIYLALVESIGIADGNNEKKNIDAIPSILSDALQVSTITLVMTICKTFPNDLISTIRKRKEFLLTWISSIRLQKVVWSIRVLISLMHTGVGKSLFMCHMAFFRSPQRK